MTPGKKATPGQSVSPAEINDLIVRARDLRTHVETNRRHLAMIDKRLTAMEVNLTQIKEAFDRVEAEVEDPEPPQEIIDEAEEFEKESKEEEGLGFVYDDGFLESWKLTPVKVKG